MSACKYIQPTFVQFPIGKMFENENPSIGIILCPEADKTVVEYAMSRSMSPTMVAEYKHQLIPKEKMQVLLQEYCDLVQIEKGGNDD